MKDIKLEGHHVLVGYYKKEFIRSPEYKEG